MANKKAVARADKGGGKRPRKNRTYPGSSFTDALVLGEAIMKHAAGGRIRRLTLMEKLQRSPTSSITDTLITNSTRYGISVGSRSSEWIELTEEGKAVCDPATPPRRRVQARFLLSVERIPAFKALYDEYQGKRLPDKEVMKDFLQEASVGVEDFQECIDLFIVNVKGLGLLRTIAGAETLIPIDQAVEEMPDEPAARGAVTETPQGAGEFAGAEPQRDGYDWDRTCFYITPIGSDGTPERKHADLFLSYIVEPAVKELGLTVVRADRLSHAGMITTQVIEHIKRCGLVIADLSFLNANVFYEMALRHACKLPIVHIIRKADPIPFDVKDARCVVIDNTDQYTLIPKLQTYQAEIASQARNALADPEHAGNPITVFCPAFWE